MTELKAKPGYVYTNGTVCGDTVYLSDIDSPDNWTEIPEENAAEIAGNAAEIAAQDGTDPSDSDKSTVQTLSDIITGNA